MLPAEQILNNDSIERLLLKQGDFYLVRDLDKARELPNELLLGEGLFVRHMGFIYLPARPENLTEEQIVSLGKLRERYFNQVVDMRYVQEIYTHTYKLISRTISEESRRNGVRILDFGAGTGSLARHIKYSGIDGQFPLKFYALDLIKHHKDTKRNLYAQYKVIDFDSTFPYRDGFFDCAVSLYVFHYSVPRLHFQEIRRTLCQKGVLIFNLYKPTPEFRQKVLGELEEIGFDYNAHEIQSHMDFHGMAHHPVEFFVCYARENAGVDAGRV